MNWRRIFLVLIMAVGSVYLFLAFAGQQSASAITICDRYVLAIGGADSTDCSSEKSPCKTIQYAIDQASTDDRICVAKHTLAGPLEYKETLLIEETIYLDGAWDAACIGPTHPTCSFTKITCTPSNVTIDADGAGRVVTIKENTAPTVDCFTITGGDADGEGGDPYIGGENDAGGGIFSSEANPVIINNIIG